MPQVAGSAVAAVAAAVAASQLGVYGTILGAGVMSVVATCGGSVFQHFFRRTGEQIREVTVQVTHPGGRQVAVLTRETTRGRSGAFAPDDADPGRTRLSALTGEWTGPAPADPATRVWEPDRTVMLRPDQDRTRLLRTVPAPADVRDDATRALRITGPGLPPEEGGPDEEFSEATVHGSARRGRRKPVIAALVVFVLSMLGITGFELISGNDLSGGNGTTVGSVVRGSDPGTADPAPAPSTGGDSGSGTDGTGSGAATSPSTGTGEDGASAPATPEDGGAATTPAPTPTDGATTPAPSATPSSPAAGDGASTAPEQPADSTGAATQDPAAGGE
ncbi:hypothetical protein [Streptomyces sp. NBC_00102]|uniref:hypothetical protein n=1 Tax=Streptomyces sp. NBC_00102 TaxID=2975652 RepID=UPI002B1D567B|nr:hypothetical protein [Streptomyces sp. NBC_00102]